MIERPDIIDPLQQTARETEDPTISVSITANASNGEAPPNPVTSDVASEDANNDEPAKPKKRRKKRTPDLQPSANGHANGESVCQESAELPKSDNQGSTKAPEPEKAEEAPADPRVLRFRSSGLLAGRASALSAPSMVKPADNCRFGSPSCFIKHTWFLASLV